MSYDPTITPPSKLTNPRWLCPGCATMRPIREGEPSYPICDCGQRMSMIHANELDRIYVTQQRVAGG